MYSKGGHKAGDYRRDFRGELRLTDYAMNKKMVKIYFSDEVPVKMPPPPPRSALPVKTSRPSSRYVTILWKMEIQKQKDFMAEAPHLLL